MTLGLSLSGVHHRTSHEDQQEIREAKTWLMEQIRNDWDYATLPPYTSSGVGPPSVPHAHEQVAGFRFHVPAAHDRGGSAAAGALGLGFEPVQWQEREYTSEESDEAGDGAGSGSPSSKGDGGAQTPYKFDGPESVGAQLAVQRNTRKRKRQRTVAEEAQWNEGLAHWMRRRDVWCGARSADAVQSLERSARDHSGSSSEEATDASTPRTSTSSSLSASSTPHEASTSTPDSSLSGAVSKMSLGQAVTPPATPPSLDVMIPIAPPVLSTHPVRRRIDRNSFPEIYSKIIIQSRTPSIPINLRTLVGALVQGWKADDEWPPKPGPLERSIGRKKGQHHEGTLRQGVKAVGRVLRITGTGTNDAGLHKSRQPGR